MSSTALDSAVAMPPTDANSEDGGVESGIPSDSGDATPSPSQSAAHDSGADATAEDAGSPCSTVECGEHATCIDEGDTFHCACARGFAGDGEVCQPAVFAVAAGFSHTCALIGEGRVRCWGGGGAQLGLEDLETNSTQPASVLPDVDLGGALAESISAGGFHTCVMLVGGRVRCWGSNGNGEVGLGNTNTYGDDESPNVAELDIDFGPRLTATQVVAGWRHTCALLSTGAVRCWGLGNEGQLGNGGTSNWGDAPERSVAIQRNVQLSGRATQVVTGGYHSCALLESGAVQCWGSGEFGQLGLGNTVNMGDNETALESVHLGTGIKATELAAGDQHTCALLEDGAVRCWGSNARGQLGRGNTDDLSQRETPSSSVLNVGLGSGALAKHIAAGWDHTCATLSDGQLRCWGFGGYGMLGIGSTDWIGDDEKPSSVSYDVIIGEGLEVAQAGCGYHHTCALLTNGAVRCWGEALGCGYGKTEDGYFGNVGDGMAPYPTPASAGNVPVF